MIFAIVQKNSYKSEHESKIKTNRKQATNTEIKHAANFFIKNSKRDLER